MNVDEVGGCGPRWGLVAVQALVDASPYEDLADDAQAVAERLLMLAHLTMNPQIWSTRLDRYWGAFTDAAQGAAMSATCVDFWCKLTSTMGGVPLAGTGLLHEKNLLVRPALLDPPVADRAVLGVVDTWCLDLVDRVRVWVRVRKNPQALAYTGPVREELDSAEVDW